MRVALIRHPAVMIAPGICYGRMDLPLHRDSWTEIPRIVREVDGPGVGVIWSSPAQRCKAVADAISNPVQCDDRLLELDFGEWEGVAWDAVPRAALDVWADAPADFAAPGGESVAALVLRVAAFHADLIADNRDAVVVSHGGPLRILRSLLLGLPVDVLAPPPGLGAVEWVTAAGPAC